MNKIKIDSKEYPCRITMGAMVRFKRVSGKDIREINQDDVTSMLLFVWCCVKSACNADGVAFEQDFDTFADKLNPDEFADFFGEVEETTKKKETAHPTTAEV